MRCGLKTKHIVVAHVATASNRINTSAQLLFFLFIYSSSYTNRNDNTNATK